MSDNTHIEWTDATWNPITGCSVVSAGCKHCYAMKLAGTRLQHHPSRAGLTVETKAGPVWNGQVRFNPEWLHQPIAWRRPRRIFVCAHGDLFHESVPDEWIDQVFAVMALSPDHSFQVLTKRAERMRRYFENLDYNRVIESCRGADGSCRIPKHTMNQVEHHFGWWPESDLRHRRVQPWPLSNVWLGVSVEDQATANERIPLLLTTPARLRWISAEPLLGPVDLSTIEFPNELGNMECWDALSLHDSPDDPHLNPATAGVLDWVVVGGESGTGARPMQPAWARVLRDQCEAAGVSFLFKQWGSWAPTFTGSVDGGKSWRDTDAGMSLVGKKKAGRQLDGRLHDEYPA